MKAIILAAGVGSRIGPIGKETPKCLLPISGNPLLQIQVDILKSRGIDDIRVVIGQEGECWTEENTEKVKAICENIVINDCNVSKKRVYTMLKGTEHVDKGPVLLIDGDLLFGKVVIDKILESNEENLALVQKVPKDFEKRRIITEEDKILKFGVKEESEIAYAYGGFMKMSNEVFKTFKKELNNPENIELTFSNIMDRLCKDHLIKIILSEDRWINMNKEEDIKIAENICTRKNKAVLWDMDGVIFDSEPFQIIAYKKAFGNQGLEIKESDYTENTGRRDMFQRICAIYDANCDFDKWFKEKKEVYWAEMEKGINRIPGVQKIIEELDKEGWRQVVATSTSRINVLFILNKLGIRDYFEDVLSFEDVEKGKPNPEIFIKAAGKAGVEAGKCIVFEDSNHGIQAAKSANMKCIAVTVARRVRDEGLEDADLVINTLEEVDVKKLNEMIGG